MLVVYFGNYDSSQELDGVNNRNQIDYQLKYFALNAAGIIFPAHLEL